MDGTAGNRRELFISRAGADKATAVAVEAILRAAGMPPSSRIATSATSASWSGWPTASPRSTAGSPSPMSTVPLLGNALRQALIGAVEPARRPAVADFGRRPSTSTSTPQVRPVPAHPARLVRGATCSSAAGRGRTVDAARARHFREEPRRGPPQLADGAGEPGGAACAARLCRGRCGGGPRRSARAVRQAAGQARLPGAAFRRRRGSPPPWPRAAGARRATDAASRPEATASCCCGRPSSARARWREHQRQHRRGRPD